MTDTPKDRDMDGLLQKRLRETPLYEGSGETSDLGEQAADLIDKLQSVARSATDDGLHQALIGIFMRHAHNANRGADAILPLICAREAALLAERDRLRDLIGVKSTAGLRRRLRRIPLTDHEKAERELRRKLQGALAERDAARAALAEAEKRVFEEVTDIVDGMASEGEGDGGSSWRCEVPTLIREIEQRLRRARAATGAER